LCTYNDVCYILENFCFGSLNDSSSRESGMKTHTSLVQKLIRRLVTGQGLGLSVHAHTGLTIHLSWNPGVCRVLFKIVLPDIPYNHLCGMRLYVR